LRRKGYDNEPAKDLTQGFFHEIVIGRELIQQADQKKGRFRTFLLTALDRYTSSVFQRETAKKRKPTQGFVQIDTSGLSDILAGNDTTRPEFIFHYTWAVQLLDEVIEKLKQELSNDGKLKHWNVFRQKVLEPILDNKTPPALKDICQKYDIQSERKASNMIITVKRRFHALLKRCLKRFVSSESDIDEEFAELMKILSESSAG
jgi:RNA polymerase sigma-70 factor (ECF subfamily)